MIQNADYWREWEYANVLSRPLNFTESLRLLDAMYEEARLLGQFSAVDPLAGLETKLRMARVVNVCGAS